MHKLSNKPTQKPTKDLSNRVIVRPSELPELYGISRSTGYKWVKKGILPPLKKLGPKCSGWPKAELDKHFGISQ